MSMSTEFWNEYGTGEIVCMCDNCQKTVRIPFEHNDVNYYKANLKLKYKGWVHQKYGTELWREFCSIQCRRVFETKHKTQNRSVSLKQAITIRTSDKVKRGKINDKT